MVTRSKLENIEKKLDKLGLTKDKTYHVYTYMNKKIEVFYTIDMGVDKKLYRSMEELSEAENIPLKNLDITFGGVLLPPKMMDEDDDEDIE